MGKFSPSVGAFARRWLIGGIKLQFLLSALSLPILIAWGLPLSIMSVVGNLLSTPFFMGVLMLSSLLFLTEMLHVPNSLLCWAIEHLTVIWHYLLNLSTNAWLIGFGAPPHGISFLLCAAIAWGLWYVSNRYKISIIWTSSVAMLLCFGMCFIFQYQFAHTLEHFSCIKRNGKRLVIDDGFFVHKTSYKSPTRYKIKPLLYKTFGSNHIYHWHCTYAGIRSLRALLVVLDDITIDEISFGVIPKYQNDVWRDALQALEEKCLATKTKLSTPERFVKNPKQKDKKDTHARHHQTRAMG